MEQEQLMERIKKLCRHPLFVQKMDVIGQQEKSRIYCRHGYGHLLDTARLMYIRVLEERRQIRKDVIYAAALLHDIGRADEYTDGLPHHEAGAALARQILEECGYDRREIDSICGAILEHRGGSGDVLSELLRYADKHSRLCFCCAAYDTCKWPEEKKNTEVVI